MPPIFAFCHERPAVKYRRTPLIRINWDSETSETAENPDNRIFDYTIIANLMH